MEVVLIVIVSFLMTETEVYEYSMPDMVTCEHVLEITKPANNTTVTCGLVKSNP